MFGSYVVNFFTAFAVRCVFIHSLASLLVSLAKVFYQLYMQPKVSQGCVGEAPGIIHSDLILIDATWGDINIITLISLSYNYAKHCADEVEKHFKWNCTAKRQICAQQKCGVGEEAQKLYFANGRYPNGDILEQERIRYTPVFCIRPGKYKNVACHPLLTLLSFSQESSGSLEQKILCSSCKFYTFRPSTNFKHQLSYLCCTSSTNKAFCFFNIVFGENKIYITQLQHSRQQGILCW